MAAGLAKSKIVVISSCFLLAFFSLTTLAFATQIAATVDRTRIGPDASLRLSVSLPDGDAQVDVSAIHDFKVLSSGSSTSVQIINGSMSKEVRHTYTLFPLRSGRLEIPALTVSLDGETYKTDPITVHVEKQKTGVRADRDVFVTASVSDTAPFVGQQIMYTFRFFRAVQVANAGLRQPEFEGFTAQEVDRGKPYRKVVNGREFIVTEILYVLIPLEKGNREIGAAVLNCDVPVARSRRRPGNTFDDFFNSPFFSQNRYESRVLRTATIPITVRPLPPDSGNGMFSGLVGQFDLTSRLDRNALKVGESATLTLTLSGKGNVMDAEAPDIRVPDAFKAYPDAPEDKVDATPGGYKGRKTFRTALVAVKSGSYGIPPVELRYFDTAAGEYRTLKSEGYKIQVSPSGKDDTVTAYTGEPDTARPLRLKKRAVKFSERDILPVKDALDAIRNHGVINLVWFILALAAPALGAFGVVSAQRLRGKEKSPRKIMAEKAQAMLRTAAAKADSATECLALLYKAVVAAIASRAGIVREAVTYDEAAELLNRADCDAETTRQALDLMQRLDSCRYSGASAEGGDTRLLIDDTRQLIRRIMK